MADIPAPVLMRFESDLAAKLGLMRKKITSKSGSHNIVNLRGGKGRGRMNSPLASLPNLNTDIHTKEEVTLPAIANQPKHSSQIELGRNADAHSSMNASRYGGGSYNRNLYNHSTVEP